MNRGAYYDAQNAAYRSMPPPQLPTPQVPPSQFPMPGSFVSAMPAAPPAVPPPSYPHQPDHQLAGPSSGHGGGQFGSTSLGQAGQFGGSTSTFGQGGQFGGSTFGQGGQFGGSTSTFTTSYQLSTGASVFSGASRHNWQPHSSCWSDTAPTNTGPMSVFKSQDADTVWRNYGAYYNLGSVPPTQSPSQAELAAGAGAGAGLRHRHPPQTPSRHQMPSSDAGMHTPLTGFVSPPPPSRANAAATSSNATYSDPAVRQFLQDHEKILVEDLKTVPDSLPGSRDHSRQQSPAAAVTTPGGSVLVQGDDSSIVDVQPVKQQHQGEEEKEDSDLDP